MSNEELIALLKKNPISVACGLLALVIAVTIYYRSDLVPDAAKLLEQKTAEGERLNANVTNAAQLPEQLAAIPLARTQIEKRLVLASAARQKPPIFLPDRGLRREPSSSPFAKTPFLLPKPGSKPVLIGVGYTASIPRPIFYGDGVTFAGWKVAAHFCRVTQASIGTPGNNRHRSSDHLAFLGTSRPAMNPRSLRAFALMGLFLAVFGGRMGSDPASRRCSAGGKASSPLGRPRAAGSLPSLLLHRSRRM